MRDLVADDPRQLLVGAQAAVHRVQGIDRHGDDLLIGARLVLHHQRAQGPATDDSAGDDRHLADHQGIAGVAIFRERLGDEAVIARIVHRGVEETVDEEGARFLVEFVFHRHAAEGDLDDDVEVDGRIAPRGNRIEIQGDASSFLPPNIAGSSPGRKLPVSRR